MNKFKVLAMGVALLSVVGCDKPGGEMHEKFIKMCSEDPRAKDQGFDCVCQATILEAVLKKEEMTQLVNFLDVEKVDRNKAMELAKEPKYTPMFQKIGGIGLAIHDKCTDPAKEKAAMEKAAAAVKQIDVKAAPAAKKAAAPAAAAAPAPAAAAPAQNEAE